MKRIFMSLMSILAVSLSGRAQSQFTVETDFPHQGWGPYSLNLDTLKKYSEAESKTIFNQVLNSGITFNYPQGGCQQRAEIIHLMLKNKFHVSHAKIWLFAPKDLVAGNNTLLKIQDANHLVPGDTITWAYHVAPCIIRRNNLGSLDTLVIDPSLDISGPLPVRRWFKKMKNSEVSKFTFLNAQWYFFNTIDGSVLNGFFYSYGAVPNNTKTTYDQLVLERELAINDVAIFMKNKLDSGMADPKGNFKVLLGNVSHMIDFFTPQERYQPSFYPITYRQLFYDNSDLAVQSVKFYTDRFLYWVTLTQKMGI